MRVPLWIGGPAVFALAAVDAALEVQTRAVGALTRALIYRTGTVIPEHVSTGLAVPGDVGTVRRGVDVGESDR